MTQVLILPRSGTGKSVAPGMVARNTLTDNFTPKEKVVKMQNVDRDKVEEFFQAIPRNNGIDLRKQFYEALENLQEITNSTGDAFESFSQDEEVNIKRELEKALERIRFKQEGIKSVEGGEKGRQENTV